MEYIGMYKIAYDIYTKSIYIDWRLFDHIYTPIYAAVFIAVFFIK